MNLLDAFAKGQEGQNKGLYMGDGLQNVSKAVNGVQRGKLYAVAGANKSGKSTFVDEAFVIQPWLDAVKNDIPIEFLYYSFEIDRISKEFDFLVYFMYQDYGIEYIKLEEDVIYTLRGEKQTIIPISSDYLKGILLDDEGKIIKVKPSIIEVINTLYQTRIVPLFGEYDKTTGQLVKKGVIKFMTNADNPTGIYKDIVHYAETRGEFVKHAINHRLLAYKLKDERLYTIVILDHIRKCKLESGFQLKQAVDKVCQYFVELRNLCNFTFVPIIHTNRSISDMENVKYAGDELYPTSDNIKDTSNIAEDCNYLFTIFNPNEDKYKLKKHFGLNLKDNNNNSIYPNLRTVHLVESRHCIYPQHFKLDMLGNVKSFKQLTIK